MTMTYLDSLTQSVLGYSVRIDERAMFALFFERCMAMSHAASLELHGQETLIHSRQAY